VKQPNSGSPARPILTHLCGRDAKSSNRLFLSDRIVSPYRGEENDCMRMRRIPISITAVIGGVVVACLSASGAGWAQALDEVSFGTAWVAEASHGGFYQAVADGTYRKHGLDVTIVQGGPLVNNQLLLAVGKLDFSQGDTLQSFDAVRQGIPTLAVAAMSQKDPQVMIAHPDRGIDSLKDLRGLTLFISQEGFTTYFQWLKREFGLLDSQVRPYTFNPQPFIVDLDSAMQGYVTLEPYAIDKITGIRPKVFLLADNGFSSYSNVIQTRREIVDGKADMVQRFVDASIIGFYGYLYSDNRAANQLIKGDNPKVTDDEITHAIATMKEYGIVDSGDAKELGIGAMTEARMASFFDKMVKAGVVKADLDYRKSYTLRFVNKKIGMDLRRN
jgi:NitT/TauT family transport system substrate-binding protein